jgi:hypothetical protein
MRPGFSFHRRGAAVWVIRGYFPSAALEIHFRLYEHLQPMKEPAASTHCETAYANAVVGTLAFGITMVGGAPLLFSSGG